MTNFSLSRMNMAKGKILLVIVAIWALMFFFLFPLLEDQNTLNMPQVHGWNTVSLLVGIMLSLMFWVFAILFESKTVRFGVLRHHVFEAYTFISLASLGFGVVILTTGGFDSQKTFSELSQIVECLQWSETKGEIISVEEKFGIPEYQTNIDLYKRLNSGKKIFWLDIRYRYKINGLVFESSRARLLSDLGGTLQEANSFQKYFFPEKPVWVYVDEANPRESILLRNYWLLFIGSLFLFFGFLMAFLALGAFIGRIKKKNVTD